MRHFTIIVRPRAPKVAPPTASLSRVPIAGRADARDVVAGAPSDYDDDAYLLLFAEREAFAR